MASVIPKRAAMSGAGAQHPADQRVAEIGDIGKNTTPPDLKRAPAPGWGAALRPAERLLLFVAPGEEVFVEGCGEWSESHRASQRRQHAVRTRRQGEVRYGRLDGRWADSVAVFMAGQVRYRFAEQWHALAEYRRLDVGDGGDRQGLLLGIDRDIGQKLRIGAGYDFTAFSDDLTDLDYDQQGWFINITGSY
jgi:hypothetical protein